MRVRVRDAVVVCPQYRRGFVVEAEKTANQIDERGVLTENAVFNNFLKVAPPFSMEVRMRAFGVLLVSATVLVGTANGDQQTLGLLAKAREIFKTGNFEEAERYHRLALESAQRAGDPAQLGEVIGDLGGVLLARGRHEEAEDLCLKALDLLRKVHAKRYLPVVLNNLGVLSMHYGNYVQSEVYFKESIKIARGFDPPDPYQGRVLNNLGTLYYTIKDIGQAEKAFKNAIAVIETEGGRDRAELASICGNLGAIYVVRKKWDSAAALFDKALFVLHNSENPGDLLVNASVLDAVGVMHHARNQLDEAERALRQAYDSRRALLGKEHPLPLLTGLKLATILLEMKRYNEAETLIDNALNVYENSSRLHSAEAVTALEYMATLLRQTDREEGAKALEDQAHTIRFALEHTVRASTLK